jgi:hypothetical protein
MNSTTAIEKFSTQIETSAAHGRIANFLNLHGRRFVGFEVEEVEERSENEEEVFATIAYTYRTPYGQNRTIVSDSVRVVAAQKAAVKKGVRTAVKDRAKLVTLNYVEDAAEEALTYILETLGKQFGGIPFAAAHTIEGGAKGVKPNNVTTHKAVIRTTLVIDGQAVIVEEVEEDEEVAPHEDDARAAKEAAVVEVGGEDGED